MSQNGKPYFELELVAYLNGEGLRTLPVADLPDGDVLDAVKGGFFAELNIPYHTEEAHYCYIFHLFNRLHHEIALGEALLIQTIIGSVHSIWGHRCTQVDREAGDNGQT